MAAKKEIIMGTLIVGLILLIIVAAIVRSMIKGKKNGKSILGCDGDCSHCQGGTLSLSNILNFTRL